MNSDPFLLVREALNHRMMSALMPISLLATRINYESFSYINSSDMILIKEILENVRQTWESFIAFANQSVRYSEQKNQITEQQLQAFIISARKAITEIFYGQLRIYIDQLDEVAKRNNLQSLSDRLPRSVVIKNPGVDQALEYLDKAESLLR